AAGRCRQAQRSLPAAATISTSRSRHSSTARWSHSSASPSASSINCPPLTLIRCAPASTASSIPRVRSSCETFALWSEKTGTISPRHSGASPSTGLFLRPKIMLATCVRPADGGPLAAEHRQDGQVGPREARVAEVHGPVQDGDADAGVALGPLPEAVQPGDLGEFGHHQPPIPTWGVSSQTRRTRPDFADTMHPTQQAASLPSGTRFRRQENQRPERTTRHRAKKPPEGVVEGIEAHPKYRASNHRATPSFGWELPPRDHGEQSTPVRDRCPFRSGIVWSPGSV